MKTTLSKVERKFQKMKTAKGKIPLIEPASSNWGLQRRCAANYSDFCTKSSHRGGVRGRDTTFFSLHLKELRYRAFYFFFSFCTAFLLGTCYASPLTHLLCTPFFSAREKQPFSFIFTHVTEGLYAAVDVSFMYTLCFCIPFFIYQVYSFFLPSCYQGQRRSINFILCCAAALFLISLYTAFVFLLPKICNFLQQFQYESKCMEIKLEARIAPAVRWCSSAFLFTAIFFQIPLLLALLISWGVVEYKFLQEKRKYVFFSLLLISSFFSPPDVSSQCALALGGYMSYELFLWSALFHQQWYDTFFLDVAGPASSALRFPRA